MATSRITVSTHGALFTGQARRDIRRFLDETKEEVARSGEQQVKRGFRARIRQHNTPHGVGYVSQIHTKKLSKFNDQLITDGGVIYGPWLESGKYSPPRRFKGYRVWRSIGQRLRKWWVPVAQRKLDRLIARWNS